MKTKKKPVNKAFKVPSVPANKTKEVAAMALNKVPPPAPKKAPPPPPPVRPKIEEFPANSVLRQLGERPPGATVLQYSRPAMGKEPPLVIVVPAHAYGDFSSFTVGTVRWGKMRGPDEITDFVPLAEDGAALDRFDEGPPKIKEPPRPPGDATEADLPVKITKPRAPREGVCAFIDALIMEGTRTAEAIRDLAVAKFPGRDPQATLSTVKTRPAHIKAKGQVPPPFKK